MGGADRARDLRGRTGAGYAHFLRKRAAASLTLEEHARPLVKRVCKKGERRGGWEDHRGVIS